MSNREGKEKQRVGLQTRRRKNRKTQIECQRLTEIGAGRGDASGDLLYDPMGPGDGTGRHGNALSLLQVPAAVRVLQLHAIAVRKHQGQPVDEINSRSVLFLKLPGNYAKK